MMKSVALDMPSLATAAGIPDLKVPSDTRIVPISRTISSVRLVDGERPSTKETPSDAGRKAIAPPSSNVTENLRLDGEIRSEANSAAISKEKEPFQDGSRVGNAGG